MHPAVQDDIAAKLFLLRRQAKSIFRSVGESDGVFAEAQPSYEPRDRQHIVDIPSTLRLHTA
jgi:hypothetical protein